MIISTQQSGVGLVRRRSPFLCLIHVPLIQRSSSSFFFYGNPKSCFIHIDSVGIGTISYPIRMVIIMGDEIAIVELESN
ncbi:hypothetical protein EPH95_09665 [Salicibibacter halophilus]|uniref:Uncharacterized protein n=1 Tax=Salicibibacter halophilus TaxID=2502791 RepID=A0A514LHT9_9BACI|nr:hypothetical protein [Salicibibacter halophilus]QDI91414.1 hypothetical protein EPH95_09665 [Salicibibacter halophilus]